MGGDKKSSRVGLDGLRHDLRVYCVDVPGAAPNGALSRLASTLFYTPAIHYDGADHTRGVVFFLHRQPCPDDRLGSDYCCSADRIGTTVLPRPANYIAGTGAYDLASLPTHCRDQRADVRLGGLLGQS